LVKRFIVDKHDLIPKHIKLSDKEKSQLFEKYNVSLRELPKILKNDPAIARLNAREGDVIKVIRKNDLEDNLFYRGVVNA